MLSSPVEEEGHSLNLPFRHVSLKMSVYIARNFLIMMCEIFFWCHDSWTFFSEWEIGYPNIRKKREARRNRLLFHNDATFFIFSAEFSRRHSPLQRRRISPQIKKKGKKWLIYPVTLFFAGNSIFSKLQMLLQGILEEINHWEAKKGFLADSSTLLRCDWISPTTMNFHNNIFFAPKQNSISYSSTVKKR